MNNNILTTESGTFERFMSGASPSMLELTNKFSDRLAEECKERGLSLRIQKQNQHQTLYIIADEAYILENDGIIAQWQPINIHFS